MKYDLVCMGRSCVDDTLLLPGSLSENQKIPVLQRLKSGGGQAATSAVVVSLLGGKSVFAGNVGQDEAGDFILSEFSRYGVCSQWVRRPKGYVTPSASILVNSETAERTILYEPTDVTYPLKLPLEALANARAIIPDPEIRSEDLRELLRVRHPDSILVYDAERKRSSLEAMMEHADFFIASETILDLSEYGSRKKALEGLTKRIQGEFLLTFGEHGSVWCENDIIHHVSSMEGLKPVDTTGAGDVYHAAFSWFFPRTRDVLDSMRLATVCAGISTTRVGTRHSDLFEGCNIESMASELKISRLQVDELLCL